MFFERFTEKARTAVVLAQQQARERGDDDDRHRAPATRPVRGAGQPGRDGAGGVRGAARRRRGRPGPAPPGRRDRSARRTRVRSPRWASTSTRSAARSRRRSVRARWTGSGVRVGRRWGGHIPFARESKKTLELALREAIALGHNYIGTEHMLLAMLRGGRRRARRAGGAGGAAGRRTGDRRGAGAQPPGGVSRSAVVVAARWPYTRPIGAGPPCCNPGAPCEHRRRAHRRRHDLPGLPRAPARGAARPRDRDASSSTSPCTTCASWTHDVHQAVDDAPYGGGPGMVMRPQVWGEALDAVLAADPRPPRLVVPTPAGRPFTQATARTWAAEQRLVFACGRYEGIDQRVVDEATARMPVDEVSIGDYVLVGGEVGRAGDGRGGRPAAARSAGQPRVGRAGLLLRRVARGPVLHAAGGLARTVRFLRCCAAATTPRSRGGGATKRWSGRRHRRPELLAALPEDALDAADRALLAGLECDLQAE